MKFVHSAFAAIAVSVLAAGCSGGSSSFYPTVPDGGGPAAGAMTVKVEAEAPFVFERAQYTILFNTSGSGVTPLGGVTKAQFGWKSTSYALIAGGDGKEATAGPVAFLQNPIASIPPTILALVATPQQFTFNPNSNGLGTEYEITFERALFSGAKGLPARKSVWTFNALVSDPNLHDARFQHVKGMRACEGCFVSPRLNVTQPFDVVEYVTAPLTSGDPATHLLRIEIQNNP